MLEKIKSKYLILDILHHGNRSVGGIFTFFHCLSHKTRTLFLLSSYKLILQMCTYSQSLQVPLQLDYKDGVLFNGAHLLFNIAHTIDIQVKIQNNSQVEWLHSLYMKAKAKQKPRFKLIEIDCLKLSKKSKEKLYQIITQSYVRYVEIRQHAIFPQSGEFIFSSKFTSSVSRVSY
ncbi:hypothetical protein FGO68_gene2076 [Halteria grandinella]|uniref:Uncharacterized protein n=1 Tax=Halteria grandinella TaxID=5974 RepID=A0A8J8P0H1_HALGN|nr:hypothetical protein FGO68_gene2076 [Halteria grandinella]